MGARSIRVAGSDIESLGAHRWFPCTEKEKGPRGAFFQEPSARARLRRDQRRRMRFDRAGGLDTARPLCSRPKDAFASRGGDIPLGAGHDWLLLALKASAAAMRASSASPSSCEKSSATEQPGTETPTSVPVWFAGENPSE